MERPTYPAVNTDRLCFRKNAANKTFALAICSSLFINKY